VQSASRLAIASAHQETIEFVARKKAEGKTHREAIRCSSATSPPASGSCCARPTRCQNDSRTINLLTKEQQ
jgi:hypothetical protein